MAVQVTSAATAQQDILLYLSEEEKSHISQPVAEKLNNYWNSKLEEISTLQAEIEKNLTNSDQQKFQLEKQLLTIQEKLEEEGRLRTEAKDRVSSLEEKVTSQGEDLEKSNDKVNSLLRQLEHLRAEQESLAEQSTAMASSLESKTKLLCEQKEQLRSVEEQLSATQQSKCEAMIQAEEANTLKIQLQFKERRYEQEKTLLQRQVELLQQQLQERAEEVLNLRREHSTSVLSLQSELNHALEELKVLRDEKDSFQKCLEDKSKRIDELLSSLNEQRNNESRLEETFRQEITAQKKISAIYKDSSENQTKKCDELAKGVEELRQLLREASEQYGVLEKAKAKGEEKAQVSQDQSSLLIKELKDELDRANDLIQSHMKKGDALAELSPAAAAASQLMSKGMTLTQLYSEYLNTSEKLFQAKEENKRLSRYVEQILEEIQERAPIMKRQKEDYQQSLETISALHAQLEGYIEDLEKQRVDAEDAQRRSNFLGRENDRLNQQVTDLSKQVTVLLTQVEAARAGLPPPPVSLLGDSPSNETTGGDVINQHLVTFRDVSELQEQNQKLLTSLRDLAEKMESTESVAIEAKTHELQDELEQAKKELTELKMSREKMQTVLENVTHQRDTYRTILNQQHQMANGHPQSDSSPVASGAAFRELEKLKSELQEAMKELGRAKKEHEEYRQERNKNDQLEKNEMDRLKSSLEKTRNENIRLLSHAEYNEERLKTLQSNCEAYQRQVNALIEKNNTLQGITGKHEGTIETLRDNILSLTKKLSQAEVIAVNCRKEKDLLKESEARLVAECESLHRTQYSQSLVLSNLETIKNNLARSDSETKMRYENQITGLMEQCSRLKAKMEANTEVKEANIRIRSLEEQLKLSRAEANATKRGLSDTEQQLSTVKMQLQEMQQERARPSPSTPFLQRQRNMGGSPSQVYPGSTPPPPHSSPVMSKTVRELQVQLTEERAKSAALKSTVDQAQKGLNELRKLSEEQEKQLKSSSESNKAAEEEIEKLRKSLDESLRTINELKEKVKEKEESEKALKDTMDHQLMKMTEDLEERENELEEAQKKMEESKKAESICRTEMNEQAKLAQDMQDKYEREVMFHGADLKALVTLKEKLAVHSSQLETLTVAKLKAEEALTETQNGFEEREKEMKSIIESLKARETELEEQNKSLLDQFTSLSEKMAAIQAKFTNPSSGDSANASFTEDEARSSDQLREIIKYLRREKDIATGKREVAQAEVERLEAQKKALENQLRVLNRHLADEREKNQSSLETAGKYEEIMRKVHTLDALTDSNRLLREEKHAMDNTLESLKAKVNSLETQIKPLQEKSRETENKLGSLEVEKNSLENEKELLKKRVQELVEKLNKSKPEEILRLQQELAALQKEAKSREEENNHLKNVKNHMQKTHQATMVQKNQLQQQLLNSREENKKLIEDNKKLSNEKIRQYQQNASSLEKIQNFELSLRQSKEQMNQLLQQILEVRQREELGRREIETLKQNIEVKESRIKELSGELIEIQAKILLIEKKNEQLRKIATKYKKKAETAPDSESGGIAGEEELTTGTDRLKELEDRNSALLQQLENVPKKEEMDQLKENITKLEQELKKKDEQLSKSNSEKDSNVSKLQSDYESKLQEYQKLTASVSQFKESISSQVADVTRKLTESQSVRTSQENIISAYEKEKEQHIQQIGELHRKLQMQQKQLENLQKQAAGGSKVSSGGIITEKPLSDTPPTANIKPMAAPVPAVSSPRSQGATQGGSSRTIPTASIRPMTPSSGQTSSSVGIVQPLESHSSDGAVSSTVTLPQATVTPTPVAPTSTPAQSFPSALTATVSPTPVSTFSMASTSPFPQPQTSSSHSVAVVSVLTEEMQEATGSADALISQAIAMIMPQVEDRSSAGQKRKLEATEEETEEQNDASKKSRTFEEEHRHSRDEDEDRDGEDAGEPSSSSSHQPDRKLSGREVLILSSDEEGEVPSSQSGQVRSEGLQEDDESQESGREAEAERMDVGAGEGQSASSSLQPPPRPAHEPPSSSHQSLAPFHQLPHYEEGSDDRTVPSTPTLFISRPCEGTSGDGVSSPQVPTQGFEFGSAAQGSSEAVMPSNEDLSQIAEGGTIDVTRMDLGQLDHEGIQRSMPSTPIHRSPPLEQSTEGNISSSGGEHESEDFEPEAAQLLSSGEAVSPQNEADSGMQIPLVVQEGSSQLVQEVPVVEEGDGENRPEMDEVVSSQEPHLGEADATVQAADKEDEDDQPLQSDEEDVEDEEEDEEYGEAPTGESGLDSSSARPSRNATQAAPASRKITPITWSKPPDTQRSNQKGGRGLQGSRGSTQGPRFRGVPRGRRSRPGPFSKRGGPL